MKPNAIRQEEEAMRALHAQYRRPLFAYFRKRVQPQEAAEDLTQETFVRLLQLERADSIENAPAYLFRIAANLVTDYHRRQIHRGPAKNISLDLTDADVVSATVEDRTPERVLMGKEQLAEALEALDKLSEMTRAIFVLFRLERMKQRDIAAHFGIATSTVEKHIIRATRHLAQSRYGNDKV